MNSAKLVVQVKVVKNVLGVYVEAISSDRKDARLLSLPRLSKEDVFLVMKQRQIFVFSLYISLMKISFTAGRLFERFWLLWKWYFRKFF